MKKIIAILMAATMLLTLCACGAKPKAEISGSVEPAAEETKPDIGSVNGGVYENKFIGIGCELDSNWTYSSKEELAGMVNLTAESFTDEEFKNQMLNADLFYDMMAASSDGLANMNIVIQNIGVLYGTVLDIDTYIDMNIDQAPAQMTQAGFSNIKCEKVNVSFAGSEVPAIYMTSIIQGIECYQLLVPIKQGNYIANVTFTSFMEDITGTLAGYFYSL